MSKSYRKAFVKDKPRNYKRTGEYWRRVRRVQNQRLYQDLDDENIPSPKSIVNDYDYCDYVFNLEYGKSKKLDVEHVNKYRRK